jgi:amino acid permease
MLSGTIGTGLFLGTGKSLATGGPASLLICYSIVGFIVYVTLLLLGEMATQYPVAGERYFVSLSPDLLAEGGLVRFIQCLCYPLCVSCIRFCSWLELLAQ